MMLIALLAVFVSLPVFSQTIRVTQPNAPENWPIRASRSITWEYSGVSGNVKLLLFRGETEVGIIATNLPMAVRTYSWQVGQTDRGYATPGSNYKIKAKVMGQPIADFSDRPFTISGGVTMDLGAMEVRGKRPSFQAPVKVLYPNGGESLQKAVVNEIRWESTDSFGTPRIIIKRGSSVVKTYEPTGVFAIRRGNQSTWSWVIPVDLGAGNDYRIRLENSVGRLSDESDGNFSITEDPLIVVNQPRGGSWTMGDRRHIEWRASGAGNLDLLLEPAAGGRGYMIKSNVPPAPSRFFWTIGNFEYDNISFIPPRGVKYKIIVRDHSGSPSGESAEFEIYRPSITILEPSGGTVHRGDDKTIRWRTGAGFVGNVDIELYLGTPDGSFRRFDQLYTDIRDMGSASWHVYPPLRGGEAEIDAPPADRHYFIRVKSSRCPMVFGDGAAFMLHK